MSIYSWLQTRLPPTAGFVDVMSKLTCGAAAGVLAQSLMYPGDTLRRRMQTSGIGGEAKTYSSTWDCAKTMVRKEGVRGLYRGIWANTVKAVPNAVCFEPAACACVCVTRSFIVLVRMCVRRIGHSISTVRLLSQFDDY